MVPNYYNPYQYQAQAQSQPGINWVQGEAGAKSFLVGAGQSVMLMDLMPTDHTACPGRETAWEDIPEETLAITAVLPTIILSDGAIPTMFLTDFVS